MNEAIYERLKQVVPQRRKIGRPSGVSLSPKAWTLVRDEE